MMVSLQSASDEPCSLSESTPLVVAQHGEARQQEDGRDNLQELPSHRANTTTTTSTTNFCQASTGAIRVAIGAALFAGTNAAATALYRRNGATVVSLYIIRAPIIYLANALLVGVLNNGRAINSTSPAHPANQRTASSESTMNVLLLRTGSREVSQLAMLRSFLNAVKAVFLSVGYVFLTYADAFVIYKGVAVCATIGVARKLLGGNERLLPQELACGIFVAIGILFIAPPASIFGAIMNATSSESLQSSLLLLDQAAAGEDDDDDEALVAWVPRQTAGVAVVIASGLLSAFSGTLMRLLSSESSGAGRSHKATPSMLLSHLMVVFFIVNGFVAIVINPIVFDGLPSSSSWAWTKMVWPKDRIDWVLISANCTFSLVAHLATAYGYQTTRAGIVVFLQLTEIPWVYLLDVLVLGESTTTMKSVGSAIVFVSAVAVGVVIRQQRQ